MTAKHDYLIEKNVEKKFDGQIVTFKLESIKEKFKNVEYFDVDVDEEGYINSNDVNIGDFIELENVVVVKKSSKAKKTPKE